MKTIFILLDSLNRHFLNIYGNTWVKTPNIDRFAEKSFIFNNHWTGSAPCMPARRDMMTGRLNFLWRSWGPIEPFDITLQEKLRENGVFTHLVTDHYHYFEIGGENYHTQFNSWDLIRGQEDDPWVSRVKLPQIPEHLGRMRKNYVLNKTRFEKESDFPTPKTFQSAINWLNENHDADDFMLWVEAFDPHEPFDCPQEYLDLYDDDWDGPLFNGSPYQPVKESPEAIEHLRKQYAATLTMADRWLGKLLDVLDKYSLWDDTMVILTSDHGHLLGEHNYTGKNYMPSYNELCHIPLLVHLPGNNDKRKISALTQNIDLMPTLLDYYGIEAPDNLHGRSWRGLFENTRKSIRNYALYGWFGTSVTLTDGHYTYLKAPCSSENEPLYMYSAMPTAFRKYWPRESFEDIETGYFLKDVNMPVYRVPAKYFNTFSTRNIVLNKDLLFDIQKDYEQKESISDKKMQNEYAKKLARALIEVEAPSEQLERIGLRINKGAV